MINSSKILTLVLLLSIGSTIRSASCDSTVWYQNFDLLKLQSENRMSSKVKPTKYPHAEVCYASGRPKTVYMYFSERLVYGHTFENFTPLAFAQYRYRDGLYDHWDLKYYPGDSIVSFKFFKRAKPMLTRWKLSSKSVNLQNRNTYVDPNLNVSTHTYNVRKLMAHPEKLLGLVPDTLGKEYWQTVRKFVGQDTGRYAIETATRYPERDAQRPHSRHWTLISNKACYELGEGVDCAKYAPWLLEGVRVDSVKCNE
jgi:hypothetical protein